MLTGGAVMEGQKREGRGSRFREAWARQAEVRSQGADLNVQRSTLNEEVEEKEAEAKKEVDGHQRMVRESPKSKVG